MLTCQQCGDEFTPSTRPRAPRLYCTPRCRARSVARRRREGVPIDPVKQHAGASAARRRWVDDVHVEDRTCRFCGATFEARGRSNQVYCDRTCRANAASARYRARRDTERTER